MLSIEKSFQIGYGLDNTQDKPDTIQTAWVRSPYGVWLDCQRAKY